MGDTFTLSLMQVAGTALVGVILPFAMVVGVGLIWVGFVRHYYGGVLFGFAFPIAVAIAGFFMRNHANSALTEQGTPPSDMLGVLLPWSIALAAAAFLVGVVPGIIRAHR